MGAGVYFQGNPHQVYNVQKVTGTGFSPCTSDFSCQPHSTSVPYSQIYHVKDIIGMLVATIPQRQSYSTTSAKRTPRRQQPWTEGA
jgi:hypothetical protein